MPRYDFTYKDGRTQKRASVSKFSKAEAKKRYGKDDPRAQGSALQDAWFEHLREAGVRWVEPPQRKAKRTADRLEPEAHGLAQDRLRLDAERRPWRPAWQMWKQGKAILKAARIIETARRMNGQPVPADLASIADRGRRPRPRQGQDR